MNLFLIFILERNCIDVAVIQQVSKPQKTAMFVFGLKRGLHRLHFQTSTYFDKLNWDEKR